MALISMQNFYHKIESFKPDLNIALQCKIEYFKDNPQICKIGYQQLNIFCTQKTL